MTKEELKEKVEELAESKPKIEEPKDDTLSDVEKNLLKLKEANDNLAKELLRQEQLRAKIALGGRAEAGKVEISPEEKASKDAEEILKLFRA